MIIIHLDIAKNRKIRSPVKSIAQKKYLILLFSNEQFPFILFVLLPILYRILTKDNQTH